MSRQERPLEVLDHRFGAGEPLTVGVEEEYMLLDAETLALEDGRTEHELETVAIGEDPPVRSTLHRGALVSGT
jgi:hypothetical protein